MGHSQFAIIAAGESYFRLPAYSATKHHASLRREADKIDKIEPSDKNAQVNVQPLDILHSIRISTKLSSR